MTSDLEPPTDATNARETRERRYVVAGMAIPARAIDAGLHVVSTPIGNLGDITLRALATLAAADLIACEDTRVTGRLLAHYGIRVPLLAYHEHNAAEMRPRILGRMQAGSAVALVSDAGTPLISDPGYRLVIEAAGKGFRITPVPGASALLSALVAAGLATNTFLFAGFLPPKTTARRNRLEELAKVPASLVFYETGPRLAASLADMAETLGDRPATICRELTKLHEEIRRGTLGTLAQHYSAAADPKGEIVVVIAPPPEPTAPEAADIEAQLAAALTTLSVKDAAASVAQKTGLPRRDLYARALALNDAKR